jgi:hypothetical protein
MEAARTPRGKISAGEVVKETFSIYGQNIVALFGSALAIFIVIGLVAGLLQSGGGVVLALIAAAVRLAGYALYTGFVVRLVEDVRDGRRDETVGGLLSSAAPAILSLIAFGFLFGLGVALGLVLLIIPGLILLTFWALGAPAIVVEGAGPIEAFSRSWRLVRGQAWSVFATLVLVLVIVIVIQFALAAIATPIGDGALVVAAIVSSAATAPIFALAVSVMYFDLGGGPQRATTTPTAPPSAT